ncbi:MAG: hypothetical protein QOJ06_2390 [Pseudonocardiales bacterium]|nr:hypothetical protein [Pseudonocardiales bacterium]
MHRDGAVDTERRLANLSLPRTGSAQIRREPPTSACCGHSAAVGWRSLGGGYGALGTRWCWGRWPVAWIERTAYPRLSGSPSARELAEVFARRLISWRGRRSGPSRSIIGWRCRYCCCVQGAGVFSAAPRPRCRQADNGARAPIELQMPGSWPRSTTTVTGQKIICFLGSRRWGHPRRAARVGSPGPCRCPPRCGIGLRGSSGLERHRSNPSSAFPAAADCATSDHEGARSTAQPTRHGTTKAALFKPAPHQTSWGPNPPPMARPSSWRPPR